MIVILKINLNDIDIKIKLDTVPFDTRIQDIKKYSSWLQ